MTTEYPLADFFGPVDNLSGLNYYASNGYLGQSLQKITTLLKASGQKVALVSLTETRNAFEGTFNDDTSSIRKHLYALAAIPALQVADLGNLKQGNTPADTYQAVTDIISYLANAGITTLVFGGTHELTQYIAKGLNQPSVTLIDYRLDIEQQPDFHSKAFLKALTQQTPEPITVAGIQSYYIPETHWQLAAELSIDTLRLGQIRESLSEVEPLMRDTDFISFDLSAIRATDFRASNYASPNGLYTEEACQIAKYAGISDKMKVLFLSEYNKQIDSDGISAHLTAQIAWHFLWGISQRQNDYPVCNTDSYKKIFVKSEALKTDIIFYQNEENNRFWFEIPNINQMTSTLIACSETDYRMICHNEIPERLWRKARFVSKKQN